MDDFYKVLELENIASIQDGRKNKRKKFIFDLIVIYVNLFIFQ